MLNSNVIDILTTTIRNISYSGPMGMPGDKGLTGERGKDGERGPMGMESKQNIFC